MNFKKLGLLTLLISLFSIYGCKPENVGLDVDADTAVKGDLIDTATVLSRTITEDTVLTSGQALLPLGYVNDPETGKTAAELALAFHLPGITDTATLGKLRRTGVVDSAVLVLKFDTTAAFTYGDTVNTRYRVDVHQLNERVSGTIYNNKSWAFNPSVYGGYTFRPRRKTNVITRLKSTSTPDTLLPHLRIPVNAAFVNSTIKAAPDAAVATDAAFLNYFKGLYVRINPLQTTGGPGGYSFFDLNTAGGVQQDAAVNTKKYFGSSLVVYFRSGTDTLSSVFSVSSTTSPERAAASVRHDYAGTPLATQLAATGSSFPAVYLSGLAGVRTRVQFPYLKNLYQQLGNKLVINRAELVVTPVESSVTDVFKAAPRINLYRFDIARQRRPVPDAPNSGDFRQKDILTFGGFYDATKKAYRFIVTGYVQDLMSGRTEDYGTYLSVSNPGNLTDADPRPTVLSPGRVVASGSSGTAVRMKLNIIYSKLD